jgi:hypothetical protein
MDAIAAEQAIQVILAIEQIRADQRYCGKTEEYRKYSQNGQLDVVTEQGQLVRSLVVDPKRFHRCAPSKLATTDV